MGMEVSDRRGGNKMGKRGDGEEERKRRTDHYALTRLSFVTVGCMGEV